MFRGTDESLTIRRTLLYSKIWGESRFPQSFIRDERDDPYKGNSPEFESLCITRQRVRQLPRILHFNTAPKAPSSCLMYFCLRFTPATRIKIFLGKSIFFLWNETKIIPGRASGSRGRSVSTQDLRENYNISRPPVLEFERVHLRIFENHEKHDSEKEISKFPYCCNSVQHPCMFNSATRWLRRPVWIARFVFVTVIETGFVPSYRNHPDWPYLQFILSFLQMFPPKLR